MKRLFRPIPVLLLLASLRLHAGDRPDLLLIVVESLRADHLGCAGYAQPTTPVLDRLAAGGVLFSNAIATASWTMPSVMSILSGQHSERHGLTGIDTRAHPQAPSLPEQLRASGYQTVGIVANPLLHRKYGFGRGFEHYDDFTLTMGVDTPSGPVARPEDRYATASGLAATVTRQAAAWLQRRDPARPLFLFVFYFDPHYDYRPPPPYDRLFVTGDRPQPRPVWVLRDQAASPAEQLTSVALYDGEIRYTDEQIGCLLDEVARTPRGPRTLMAVTADHGEEFWEHGGVGHGDTLYDEVLRVPLIFSGAGLATPGRVVHADVSLTDLMPTLLAFAGLKTPPACQGRSLEDLLRLSGKPSLPADAPIFAETAVRRPLLAVRTAGWKAIFSPADQKASELYDLSADPGETRNLAATTAPPPELLAALAEFRTAHRAPIAAAAAAPNATDLQRLRSLGYVR